MPTKAMLHAAEVRHLARRAAAWGLTPASGQFDYPKLMARKDALIADFASHRQSQLAGGGFDFLRAQARFLDPHTVALSTGRSLTAAHFVISTGSVVSPPPLPCLAETGYLTSDDAVRLGKLPRSLIVLGGGAIACEFAQFYARLDVRVTLIQRSPRLLRDLDEDASAVVEKVFRDEGMALFTNTRLRDVRRTAGGKTVWFEQAGETVEVEAEEILFALGRAPNTADLGLDRAGVALNGAGRIQTDARMRTTAAHVYAAGDCTGPHEVVHLAVLQGEIAGHNIARPEQPRAIDHRLLTNVVFTDPQVASVGLTEREARERGVKCLAASHPFSDHGKSMILDALDGFVKLLADPHSGEILGGCCVGPLGGELIHEIIAAMAKRMTIHELAAMPHYHPTLAEIWTYPAEELAARIPLKGA
jgi:pyruvate/2-oxoglutarate dehydrogenase complex dihydrolipoamide dehydrogenase (E3) component